MARSALTSIWIMRPPHRRWPLSSSRPVLSSLVFQCSPGLRLQIPTSSTEVYTEARRIVLDFFGAPADQYIALFVKNASEGLNKLSQRLPLDEAEVLTTWMEHHSNDLPWRLRKQAQFIQLTKDGCLDLADSGKENSKKRDAPSNWLRSVALRTSPAS